jgi:hypothetical protein
MLDLATENAAASLGSKPRKISHGFRDMMPQRKRAAGCPTAPSYPPEQAGPTDYALAGEGPNRGYVSMQAQSAPARPEVTNRTIFSTTPDADDVTPSSTFPAVEPIAKLTFGNALSDAATFPRPNT